MSLTRLEKIRCYASPLFQLLNSKTKFGASRLLNRRGFRSESAIQQENLSTKRNAANTYQNSYIKGLCETFSLSPAKQISPYVKVKSNKWIQMEAIKKSEQFYGKKCKKCEKIRNTVKTFLRAKFETVNPETGKKNRKLSAEPSIRMHIIEKNGGPTAVFETLPSNDSNVVCFGCDQEKHEPSIRGPPIVSPVCKNQNEEITTSPLGEVFKKFPERLKKIKRVDRPQSLIRKNKVVEKDQNKETSVNEMQKPKSH